MADLMTHVHRVHHCRHCHAQITWREPAPMIGGWTDRLDGTDWLGSGEVCPVAYHHEPEEEQCASTPTP